MADVHFPGQDLPEHKEGQVPPAPAPEAPAHTETKTEDTPPASPTPESSAPAPEKPEEVPVTKPRSIYKDLKDTRQERNAWQEAAVASLRAQGIELKGDETLERVQQLLTQHKATPSAPAPAPAAPESTAPSKPTDPIEAFAQEKGYDPKELAQLRDLFLKDVPLSQLTAEERQTLKDLQEFKAKSDLEAKQREEDAAIMAEASVVRTTLAIHDDKEFDVVMKEVIRLAHTPQYASMPVDYILFKEKDALSKLVSPKKPSFESGTIAPASEPEVDVDLSKGGVTPEMVQKANQKGSRTELEHRKAE